MASLLLWLTLAASPAPDDVPPPCLSCPALAPEALIPTGTTHPRVPLRAIGHGQGTPGTDDTDLAPQNDAQPERLRTRDMLELLVGGVPWLATQLLASACTSAACALSASSVGLLFWGSTGWGDVLVIAGMLGLVPAVGAAAATVLLAPVVGPLLGLPASVLVAPARGHSVRLAVSAVVATLVTAVPAAVMMTALLVGSFAAGVVLMWMYDTRVPSMVVLRGPRTQVDVFAAVSLFLPVALTIWTLGHAVAAIPIAVWIYLHWRFPTRRIVQPRPVTEADLDPLELRHTHASDA